MFTRQKIVNELASDILIPVFNIKQRTVPKKNNENGVVDNLIL